MFVVCAVEIHNFVTEEICYTPRGDSFLTVNSLRSVMISIYYDRNSFIKMFSQNQSNSKGTKFILLLEIWLVGSKVRLETIDNCFFFSIGLITFRTCLTFCFSVVIRQVFQ